ncbi:MAG: polymerase III, subunit gamma and tau protein [candidate division WS6 bacterium GW2011_GWE1_34_7]|uniref:DNA polymerase III subunit gamma/tau n=1 Tax=candidate division WS6 bacterium GW2011_GWE1_34_7 TaxID=1619093 RepID=A0A0G0B9Y1_9BACT|nr:MAG: polymerase III, subunit gamma and tau protein [candidate division WS6 bacterium GW2011_GWE1_34_7]
MYIMSTVLYRKYRAQNFDELVGQDHITKILKNAVKSNQLSHAFLLVGSRGTGKTSTARILAKAVNCLKPKKDGNPCNKCDVCLSISNGNFMDMIEIDAASNRGIDQIRELKEKIEFAPSKGRFKIYIIDEVHMLTTEAFNALLKTLEEPPEHVIFILATTDVHKLPATILSRCQRYDFRLGTEEEIRGTLEDILSKEKLKVDNKGLDIIVRNARGSYRDALSLLDVVVNSQLRSEDAKKITEDEVRAVLGVPEVYMVNDLLSALLDGDSKKALSCIKELEMKGTNLVQFINFTLEVLREVLVAKISGKDIKEYSFSKGLQLRDLLSLIKDFLSVERDLRNSTNQILILQMLIPAYSKGESVEKKSTDTNIVKSSVRKNTTIVEGKSESVEVVNTDVIDLDITQVEKNWEKIAQGVKPLNTHLFAFLGASKPVTLEKNELCIEVPFKFYKDQIDTPVSRDIIGKVIFDVLGTHCRLKCIVNESVKPKLQSSADVVLKNVPVIKKKEKVEEEKKTFAPRKVKADVEAIFAGM